MGENRGKKRHRGKVDSSLTAQHIGVPNRKRAADDDPYGAGEQSGKRAKPDARSAAANARARTATVLKAEPPPTQLPPASESGPFPASLPTRVPSTPLILPTPRPPAPVPFPASLPPRAPPTPHLPPFLPPPASHPLPAPSQGPHVSFPPYTTMYNPHHFHPPLSQPVYSPSTPYHPAPAFQFSTYSHHM